MIPWPEPHTSAEASRLLEELRASAEAWASTDLDRKIELLDEIQDCLVEVAEKWVDLSCEAKGFGSQDTVAAEEWLAGPWTFLRHVILLGRTLRDIRSHGAPRLPGRARENEAGRVVAPVFPTDPLDKILFRGMSADVWMDRDVKLDELEGTMGWTNRPTAGRVRPSVSLVLGAGNVSSIGPLDTLFEVFARGCVVCLKTNPINAYLGAVWEKALAPLIRVGALRIVHGGAGLGEFLCQHDALDRVHITGSDRTYDSIVWGTGEAGAQARASGEKRLTLPISAELGNVSPVIVVPGPWSPSDLKFQAANVASSLVNNAGFNCLATRVIVTARAWDQRRAFLDEVGHSLESAAARKPYYPGALERHREYLRDHPQAKRFGSDTDHGVAWTLIEDVDPTHTDDVCFQVESWCGLMAETGLAGESPADFLADAVEFCNDTLWGSLNATILVHPKSLRDPAVARAVESAIARLRYGTVAVNLWAGAAFAIGSTPWGAYPGHTAEDIRSGEGFVHNTYLFERNEKTVVRAPFRIWPRPAWFHDTKGAATTARRLFELTHRTTPWRLARVALSAARA